MAQRSAESIQPSPTVNDMLKELTPPDEEMTTSDIEDYKSSLCTVGEYGIGGSTLDLPETDFKTLENHTETAKGNVGYVELAVSYAMTYNEHPSLGPAVNKHLLGGAKVADISDPASVEEAVTNGPFVQKLREECKRPASPEARKPLL